MNDEELVKMYEDVLHGKRIKGRYKNTNLFLIDTQPTSRVERTKDEISPPTNLNPDLLEAELQITANKARAKQKEQEKTKSGKDKIDKALLKYLKSN